MKVFLVILLTTITLHAQEAKVIALKADDAAEVKRLVEARDAAQKKLDAFNDLVQQRYIMKEITCTSGNSNGLVTTSRACASPSNYYVHKHGWENGFVYSEDFQFIVPKEYKQQQVNCIGGITYTN